MKTKTTKIDFNDYDETPDDIAFAIENSKRVYDLLPPPDQLVLKKAKKVKITMDIPERDIKFFKKHALKTGIPYQSIMREVLDRYVVLHSNQK